MRYQQARHAGSAMAETSPEEYINFLSSDWCDTLFVEFHTQDKLAAVAIVDQLPDALSAVYTFFDPDLAHLSLGNYAILWQILYAQQLKLEWLYLGYWIKHCRKMSYKDAYRPLQAFINEHWVSFSKKEEISKI